MYELAALDLVPELLDELTAKDSDHTKATIACPII
jgi:hypothetical protein